LLFSGPNKSTFTTGRS